MEPYYQQPDHAGLQTTPTYFDLRPLQQPQHQAPGEQKSKGRICGLRQTTFWLVLLLVLILLIVAIAATVGGVVGSQKVNEKIARSVGAMLTFSTTASSYLERHDLTLDSAKATSAFASSATSSNVLGSAPTSTATSKSTVSQAGTTSQPSPSSSLLRGGCPGSNGAKWTSRSGYNTFQIYCNTDFPVKDLVGGYNIPTTNLDSCLEFCASLNDQRNFTLCFGVAFGYVDLPLRACYLKNPAIDVATDMQRGVLTDSAVLVE